MSTTYVIRGAGCWGKGASIAEAILAMPGRPLAYDSIQIDKVEGADKVFVDPMGTLCWEPAEAVHERIHIPRIELADQLRDYNYRLLYKAGDMMSWIRAVEGDEQPMEHDSVVQIQHVADRWCCEVEEEQG